MTATEGDSGTNHNSPCPIYPFEVPGHVDDAVGKIGEFLVIPVEMLRVDPRYQRAITGGSANNIRRIARRFDWRRFTPIIAVPIGDGLYGVIDGQHRATAALSRGITAVPAYIISASLRDAAAAFAAINGDVTRMSALDLFRAKLAAGDDDAVGLDEVCRRAEVTLVTRQATYRLGETRAVPVLQRAYKRYGADLLTLILQCITETRDGNVGLITGAVVNGIGEAIKSKHDLIEKPTKLFDIFDTINLPKLIEDAKIENVRTLNPVQYLLTRMINIHLRDAGKQKAA